MGGQSRFFEVFPTIKKGTREHGGARIAFFFTGYPLHTSDRLSSTSPCISLHGGLNCRRPTLTRFRSHVTFFDVPLPSLISRAKRNRDRRMIKKSRAEGLIATCRD